MALVWRVLGWLFGGFAAMIAGYAVTAVLGFMLIDNPGSDSGGTEMGIMFGLAPIGALVGLVAFVVWLVWRNVRQRPRGH